MKINRYFEEIGAWPHGSHLMLRAYMTGFALSVVLTLGAYFLVVAQMLPGAVLTAAIITLALIQFIVQIVCFLHLGSDRASRSKVIILGCIAVIVLILVAGSLWIMFDLNQRMTLDPAQMQEYMNEQPGI